VRPALRPWLAGGLLCVGAAAAVVWIDRPLALASQQLGSEARALARLGSALGNSAWVLVPSAAVLLLRRAGALSALEQDWVKRCRQLFWTVAASGLLADLLKGVVARPRPKLWLRDGVVEPRWFHWFDAAWASMPSGHTVTAVTLAWLVAHWQPRWAVPAYGLAAVVAASRIALGAHYLSDTLVGAAVALWVCAAAHGARSLTADARSAPPNA